MEARLSAAVALAEEGEGRREKASAANVTTLNMTVGTTVMSAGRAATPLAGGNVERATQADDVEEAASAGDDGEVAPNGVTALPANPEDTNVWPTAAEEAAFLSDARGRGEPVVAVARAVAEDADDANDRTKLPKLDELVNRIPAETRELLDELFRAKFVAVRRVPKSALKSG